MSTNVMVVFVVCRKLIALFRVMVKTASGSASDDEAQALVKMRRDYMEYGKLWRDQIKIVGDHLEAEIRATKEGDFIRNRQYREDLGDLLTLQAKLFLLVDVMDNIMNGKREHADKHCPLFEEFMDHQVEWFRKLNQVGRRLAELSRTKKPNTNLRRRGQTAHVEIARKEDAKKLFPPEEEAEAHFNDMMERKRSGDEDAIRWHDEFVKKARKDTTNPLAKGSLKRMASGGHTFGASTSLATSPLGRKAAKC